MIKKLETQDDYGNKIYRYTSSDIVLDLDTGRSVKQDIDLFMSILGITGEGPSVKVSINADMLQGHPASDFVLNSNYSAYKESTNNKLELKAPIDSPRFTGTPTVPDVANGDSSEKAANTKYVNDAVYSLKKRVETTTINGTKIDKDTSITTQKWGEARAICISDNDGANTGAAVSVNGSGNATLKLPATIKANLSGNATSAAQAYSSDVPNASNEYISFHSGGSNGNKALHYNDGLTYSVSNGNYGYEGSSALALGNGIGVGNNGNKTGKIHLYGSSSGFTTISPGYTGVNECTLNLPSSSGTLSLDQLTPGTTMEFYVHTAGFITTNGSQIYFTVPLHNRISKSCNVVAASVAGMVIRQNGEYLFGSGANDSYTFPREYAVVNQGENHLTICATFNPTGTYINNAAAGIVWSGRITIS